MESPLRPPADQGFRLIETMLWTPEGGFERGDVHRKRLAFAARRLGIAPIGVEAALAAFEADGPQRVRLTVDAGGRPEITHAPYTPLPEGTVWRLAVAETRLDADDPWLGVKTTQRQLYDRDRAAMPADVDELIYLNGAGHVCEGTITNVFADLGQGLVTPPISDGLLPGVLRSSLICAGKVRIQHLTLDDLLNARAIYVGNSLRGLITSVLQGAQGTRAGPSALPFQRDLGKELRVMGTILTLEKNEEVTHDTRHLVFTRPEDFDIEPGQAVDLTLMRDGWRDEARPFTPVMTEDASKIEFVIKTYPEHDGVTDQIRTLEVGEQVEVSDPWGAIHDEGPGTFIAGGAGITPFIAIMRQRVKDKGTMGGATLIFSNKTEDDIILREEFEEMPGLKTIFVLTEQGTLPHGMYGGAINKDFLYDYANPKHAPFYLCGPDEMVDELEETLKNLGVPEKAIIREDFS